MQMHAQTWPSIGSALAKTIFVGPVTKAKRSHNVGVM